MDLRIVQLTDCHLFEDSARELRGHLNWPRFTSVLSHVREHVGHFDLLVISGDLAHDELPATYALVRRELGEWAPRVRIVPGNHDLRAGLRDEFPESSEMPGERVTFRQAWDSWQVIGLDTQRPGEVAGSFGAEQLEWLRGQLAATRALSTVLVFHHPPVSVQSAWLDAIGLQDAAAFAETVREFTQVRLLLCGHVHQELTASLGDVPVCTTPAVGPQFRPRSAELVVETAPPGYRLLDLHAAGRWTTSVIRLGS